MKTERYKLVARAEFEPVFYKLKIRNFYESCEQSYIGKMGRFDYFICFRLLLIHEANSFSVISPLANFSIIKTQTLSFANSL